MAGLPPGGFGMSPYQQPAPLVLFSQTGIANLSGNGYAYTPGSGMTQFLDSLNTQMANATRIAKPTPQVAPTGAAGGPNQLMTMLGALLGRLTQAGIAKRKKQSVQ